MPARRCRRGGGGHDREPGTPGSSTPPPPTAPPPAGPTALPELSQPTGPPSADSPPGGQPRLPRHRLHLAIVYPLVQHGRSCPRTTLCTCFSLTGYSGGGKKMIAQYEAPTKPDELLQPRASMASNLQPQAPAGDAEAVCGLAGAAGVQPHCGRLSTRAWPPPCCSSTALLQGQPAAAQTSGRPWPAYYAGPAAGPRGALGRRRPPALAANALAGTDGLQLDRVRPRRTSSLSPPSLTTWARAPPARRCRT